MHIMHVLSLVRTQASKESFGLSCALKLGVLALVTQRWICDLQTLGSNQMYAECGIAFGRQGPPYNLLCARRQLSWNSHAWYGVHVSALATRIVCPFCKIKDQAPAKQEDIMADHVKPANWNPLYELHSFRVSKC